MRLSYLGSMKENNMFLTPTTPDHIEVLIGSMKVNEGVGRNSIPIKKSERLQIRLSQTS